MGSTRSILGIRYLVFSRTARVSPRGMTTSSLAWRTGSHSWEDESRSSRVGWSRRASTTGCLLPEASAGAGAAEGEELPSDHCPQSDERRSRRGRLAVEAKCLICLSGAWENLLLWTSLWYTPLPLPMWLRARQILRVYWSRRRRRSTGSTMAWLIELGRSPSPLQSRPPGAWATTPWPSSDGSSKKE